MLELPLAENSSFVPAGHVGWKHSAAAGIGWVVLLLRWSLALTRLTTNSSRHNNPNMTRKINEEANFFVFSPFGFVVPDFYDRFAPAFASERPKKAYFFTTFFWKKRDKKPLVNY